jgi:nicotinamidase-related amidase
MIQWIERKGQDFVRVFGGNFVGGTNWLRNRKVKVRSMSKKLIVIDMQNDFIDMALGTPDAVSILEAVKDKIRSYPVSDVIATMDTHAADYLQTQEGQFLPVEHCIYGSEGWQLHPEIAPLLEGATIYEKPTFGSMELAADLKAMEEDLELELIGLCTDICVVSNALLLKAAMPEVPITVDAACCAGVTVEKHLAALETMRSCQIQVVNET